MTRFDYLSISCTCVAHACSSNFHSFSGLTWAGLAGILFPIPIMLLVPFRQWVLPRLFREQHLRELDKTEEEELDALDPREAGVLDLEHQELEEEDDDLEHQMHRFRVVHHLRRR